MKGIKRERITKIVEGEKLFLSTGISYVKVTRFDEESQDQEIICLEIPIQSTSISELIDTFKSQAPKPPVIDKLIKEGTPEAKELGFSRSEWVKTFDFTDAGYLKAKEEHDSDLGIAVLCKGIAVDIFDKGGNIVEDNTEKVRVMKEKGLSGEQFTQIIGNITTLTKWSDSEKSNFLG